MSMRNKIAEIIMQALENVSDVTPNETADAIIATLDTGDEAVRNILKRIGSTPFPDGFQDIADDAALMVAALAARDPDALVQAALERAADRLLDHIPREYNDHRDYRKAIRALAEDDEAKAAIKKNAGWTV